MKIVDKIKARHDEITNQDTKPEVREQMAEEDGRLAIPAALDGIKSRAWAKYMKKYASNKRQLERLCGEDPNFMGKEWAGKCMAYIVSNAICTVRTRRKDVEGELVNNDKTNEGTLNYLNTEMRNSLDEGIDPATEQNF